MTAYELPPAWMLDATCRTVDPELWFPDDDPWQAQAARRVCQSCPVVAECAEYAIHRYIPFGIWGGMTADDRRDYRRRHGIVKPQVARTCGWCSDTFYPRAHQQVYCRNLCKKRAYEATKRPNPQNRRT